MDTRRSHRDTYARLVEDAEAGVLRPSSTPARRVPTGTNVRMGAFRTVQAALQVIAVGAILVVVTTGVLYGAQRYWLEPHLETHSGKPRSEAEIQFRAAMDVNASVVADAEQAVLFTPSA